MHAEFILILSLAVIILISPFISSIFRFPILAVEIILGAIFSFIGLIGENEIFSLLSETGFLYLMLLAGMEINLKEMFKLEKKIFIYAVLFLILMYLLSLLSVFFLGFSKIFIVVFPLVSVGLILSLQQEIGKKEWLELAMKVGVIAEVVSIIVLTLLSSYFEFGFTYRFFVNISILMAVLISLAVLFFIMRTLFWWFPEIKFYLMPGIDKYHQDVRIAISLFFIVIVLLYKIGIDVVLGAFVVGVFLKTFFEHNKSLEHKLAPFGFGFLIPIFFVHVGSSLDIKLLSSKMLIDSFYIVLLMILIRIFASSVFFRILNLKSILFGISLSMPLTLMIAVAALAHQNHTINDYWYNVLVVAAVIEVIVVMVGVKILNKLIVKSEK
ncbi:MULTISPECIES: cation:proton antiporter [unclassified Lebetimonas]|uniref:cation:proton antiporter n=1 Tax=unclassified Lebetimonas TaxID=2648158 RepID=UPI000467BCA4|nr:MULTISPECIES: cation:proton antiporter [unclassified Lebetimonas]